MLVIDGGCTMFLSLWLRVYSKVAGILVFAFVENSRGLEAITRRSCCFVATARRWVELTRLLLGQDSLARVLTYPKVLRTNSRKHQGTYASQRFFLSLVG